MSDREGAASTAAANIDLFRLDEVCDRYERALRSGERPDLARALEGFEEPSRSALLGELFLLELQYHQEENAPQARLLEQIRQSHPELTTDLYGALDLVKHRLGLGGSQASQTATFGGPGPILPPLSSSRVLRIACPNCKETCTVEADSESTVVSCSLCGSAIDLSNHGDKTEEATPLTTIGHFKLTSRIGMGGCGTVWKAYDSQLDRTVAIKVPRAGQLTPAEEERFRREARTVARLQHPNIVPIHEFGRDGDLLFFVSEFVRGVSLDCWLTAKETTLRQAAELTAKLADALHYAHEQGVVHRDVKPSNILMDAWGEPHLTDFGLAMLNRPDVSHASDGFLGTPAYMSPEQAAGEAHRCDARTDVYALGVVLFQMLTGELPFRGNRDMLLYQIQFDEAASPRELNGGIPKDLETICLKCLQKPMAARYDSAQALADDLRRYLNGEPIAARPVSTPVRAWRWCLRNRAAAAALGLLVAIGVAGPAMAWRQSTLRARAEHAEAETRRFYKQYLAQAIIPAPMEVSEETQAIANQTPVVVQRLVDSVRRHTTDRMALVNPEAAGGEDSAYLYLAAGLLAGTSGAPQEALRNFELASDVLAQLHAQAPDEMRYEAALAFCQSRLVRYEAALKDYETSPSLRREAAAASEAWQKLTEERPDSFWYQNSFAESQLWLGLALGAQREALEAAKEAAQTIAAIEARWPDDARDLYLIACQLAGSPPLLAPASETGPDLR